MLTKPSARILSFEDAAAAVERGAAFVDLRPIESYLEVHIPGSLALLYQFGPGMASRARDCLPLRVPLVLLEDGSSDLMNAAASLRGKGFAVLGRFGGGFPEWAKSGAAAASAEVVFAPAEGTTVL